MREPNTQIRPVPADFEPVPSEVRGPSDELIDVRARYFATRDEVRESEQTIREAQTADAQAVRDAVAKGKASPKPTTQAKVERGAQLERELEALRVLAIEAEDHYMSACRAAGPAWAEAANTHRDKIVERERAAAADLRSVKAELQTVDHLLREIEQLGDESAMRSPAKANAFGIFDLRHVNRLSPEDETRLEELVA